MMQTPRDAARQILDTIRAHYEHPTEYAPTRATDFLHLDLDAYRSNESWMKQNGFTRVGDLEIRDMQEK